MNNYSFIQRFLHRILLSSQFIREITFDFEISGYLKKNFKENDQHIFVVGMARSGTTILLNAIYKSGQFGSLTYDDMPFILAPNFWHKIGIKKNHSAPHERSHGDGIKISTKSPEAFEEIFWKTFKKDVKERDDFFVKFISLILKKNSKSRYLSKNNQNIRRLKLISKICPSSKILIPFRDPIQQSMSLFSQHMKFIKKQNEDTFIRDYMNLIGHSEFGLDYKKIVTSNLKYPNDNELNHWLEQWYLTYTIVLTFLQNSDNTYLINYEALCNKPIVWTNLKELLEIKQEVSFSFKVSCRPIDKTIDKTIDKSLSERCHRLYNALKKNSFGL